MPMVRILLMVSALYLPHAADAYEVSTGTALYDTCTTDEQPAAWACLGYIRGVIEGQNEGLFRGLLATSAALQKIDTEKAKGAILPVYKNHATCTLFHAWDLPADINFIKIRDTIMKWLVNNPNKRELSSPEVIFLALSDAWPPTFCGPKEKPK